ncbi:MAG: hypothetical protein ABI689_12020 [Thermoanaerobaculia bacterium]
MTRHELKVDLPVADLSAALTAAAEGWGAEWTADSAVRDGGRLVLPVVFGLRRGVLVGRVDFEPSGDGSRLTWQLEESHLELQRASVAVLSLAILALLPALAWPFNLKLLALLPFAAVMGLLAWWLVISRLESSGPEEFFATVKASPPAGP